MYINLIYIYTLTIMIEPNNILKYIAANYSIHAPNNYAENIKYINSKNDLKYLKKSQENIIFSHYFDESLDIGDIPNHVKSIYFYQYYSWEIRIDVLPASLEVLFLENYSYQLNFHIIPKNVWFISINNFTINHLYNHKNHNIDYFLLNNDTQNNTLLLFVGNNDKTNDILFNLLSIKEYNDILFYFNLKKNIY
jgi:hypothetical protein